MVQRCLLPASTPVLVLTFLGALIAVLGLFAAGDIRITIVGLVAIGFAGILQVMDGRRNG
jgi:hypothetical protein